MQHAKPARKNLNSRQTVSATVNALHKIAFQNSYLASVIFEISTGKIITANTAAITLLGYTKAEILSRTRQDIFNEAEPAFKKMIKQRKSDGRISAVVTVYKKNRKPFTAAVTSALFVGEHGISKSISTIEDITKQLAQKIQLDADIATAAAVIDRAEKVKQQKLEVAHTKKVASDIAIAKAKQKALDVKNRKLVEKDIVAALDASAAKLKENNHWLKQIAKTSYDVMWDWDLRTNEIYVGESVKEVFGYHVDKNRVSFEAFSNCIPREERLKVTRKLSMILKSSKKNWADTFSLTCNDGSLAAVAARASIVRNAQAQPIRLIGAIKDVTKVRDLQMQLKAQDQQNEQLILASHLTFDVIWERNLLTNEMVLADEFCKVLKIPIENHQPDLSLWTTHLHPDDKEAVIGSLEAAIHSPSIHWECSYRIIGAENLAIKISDKATIFRDNLDVAYKMMGAFRRLSRQEELELKLEQEFMSRQKLLQEYTDKFNLMFKASSVILFDLDLRTNEVAISDAFKKNFGYPVPDNGFTPGDWIGYIHQDDRDEFIRNYNAVLKTKATEWKYSFRLLRSDKSIDTVISSAIILRDEHHHAYRIIGSIDETAKEQVLEDDLKKQVRVKEKEIAEAMEEARATERSNLGKELHDNVNQLLGVSKLYLDMAKRGGSEAELYLNRSSEYTMTAIDEIRKLTKGLTTDTIKELGLCLAVEKMAKDVMETNAVIIQCFMQNSIDEPGNDKFKMNIFRIIQEQINNILKHASASRISIRLIQNKKQVKLTIRDNGIGFDLKQKRKGIGLNNIEDRANKLNGLASFVTAPGKGCTLTASFPSP